MRHRAIRSRLHKTTSRVDRPQRRSSAEPLEQRVLLSSTITSIAPFTTSGPFGPSGTLVRDSSGNIFGIADNVGGQTNVSGIYKVAAGSSTPTLVASFPPDDGFSAGPVGLLIDGNDNIFGVTNIGGDVTLDGTIFELAKGASTITTLAQFDQATTGHGPNGNIVMNSAGDIFGVCDAGGTESGGSVWTYTKSTGTITQVAPFPEGSGATLVPNADAIAIDSHGNLFGTAGGTPLAGDLGSVWEVPAGQSTIQTLASFAGNNGSVPNGPIVVDASGNVFGVTHYGGANDAGFTPAGLGTVYEVVSGSGAITDLASFDGTNGEHPNGGLIADSSGNLYGTASEGGTTTTEATNGAGSVFEVVKNSNAITPLILFNTTNGGAPEGGLTFDTAGNLYGTTTSGDAQSAGSVFKVVPNGGSGGSGTFTATATVKSPAKIIAGQKITATINAKLTNGGATTVSTGVSFAAYLSADGTVDNNSIALVASKSQHFSIKPHKGVTARATIRGTPAATPAGTYHYIVEFKNSDGTTTDFQSTNTVTVATPVLDIGGSFAKFVSKAKHGKSVTQTITVTNSPANVAAVGTLSFLVAFLGTGSGVPIVSTPVTIKKKINIRPGKSVRIPLAIKAPTTAGGYTVFINLDASAIPAATDVDTANNSLTSPTSLIVT